jgi:hypothetical protein
MSAGSSRRCIRSGCGSPAYSGRVQQFLRLVERTLPQVAEQVEPVMVYGHVF